MPAHLHAAPILFLAGRNIRISHHIHWPAPAHCPHLQGVPDVAARVCCVRCSRARARLAAGAQVNKSGLYFHSDSLLGGLYRRSDQIPVLVFSFGLDSKTWDSKQGSKLGPENQALWIRAQVGKALWVTGLYCVTSVNQGVLFFCHLDNHRRVHVRVYISYT